MSTLEVTLLSTVHQEVMGERVSEAVRVKIGDAGCSSSRLDQVAGPIGRQRAPLGQEQGVEARITMSAAHAEIAVECSDGSGAEVDGTGLAALAGDVGNVVVEVKILNRQRTEFGNAEPTVEQDADHRFVPAVVEGLAGARADQFVEVVVGDDGYGVVLRRRGSDTEHGVGV